MLQEGYKCDNDRRLDGGSAATGEIIKCPYCDKEMISGYVQGGREVFFTETKHKWLFSHSKEEILLTYNNMTAPTCTAYHCAECKKVIIDYEEN